MLALVGELYSIEREAKNADDAARSALREERSMPVLAKIKTWLDTEGEVVLPRSPMAAAITYAQNQWAAAKGPILVLHDTTEFSFQRERPETIGKTRLLPSGRIGSKPITKCGLLMHSSLAITTAGKPLGLTAVKFWTREKFKGTNALKGRGVEGGKHSVNTTRIPIEKKESVRWLENLKQSTQLANPDRCIHIGDRESDIYELFCLAQEEQTHFLVRTCVDRLAGTGSTTIARRMNREPIQGTHQVEVLDAKRRSIQVELQLRYSQMTIHPPIGKHTKYPPLSLTVIHAWERGQTRRAKADLLEIADRPTRGEPGVGHRED